MSLVSLSKEILLKIQQMTDIVSFLIAFCLWAKRWSLLLLILNCLSTGLVTHIRIAYCLLFGHWSHKHRWCVNYFKSLKVGPHVTLARNYGCKFCVIFMFMFNLSATTGKYSFVISPLIVSPIPFATSRHLSLHSLGLSCSCL